MKTYNIIAKHVKTGKEEIVYFHDSNLSQTHAVFNVLRNAGISCKIVRDSDDVIMFSTEEDTNK